MSNATEKMRVVKLQMPAEWEKAFNFRLTTSPDRESLRAQFLSENKVLGSITFNAVEFHGAEDSLAEINSRIDNKICLHRVNLPPSNLSNEQEKTIMEKVLSQLPLDKTFENFITWEMEG